MKKAKLPINPIIGERVKKLRAERGLSQEELAKQLGYKSKSSVAHIENGRDIPRSTIATLADALGTNPAFLMGWIDDPSPLEWDSKSAEEKQAHLAKLVEDTHLDGVPAAVSVTMGLDTKKAPPRMKREDAYKKLSSLSDDEFREVELFADFIEFRRNRQK